MVGLEYGLQTGIWWGSAEYTRGEFCKAATVNALLMRNTAPTGRPLRSTAHRMAKYKPRRNIRTAGRHYHLPFPLERTRRVLRRARPAAGIRYGTTGRSTGKLPERTDQRGNRGEHHMGRRRATRSGRYLHIIQQGQPEIAGQS